MAQGDVLFREAGVLPVAHFDLTQVETSGQGPRTDVGHIAWVRDKFGAMRLFTYRKNVSNATMAAGDLTSRLFEVESNITAGSTTSATGTWNAANDHIGSLFIVHDFDSGTPGAAPEGEASIVASNTATVVTLESSIPLSAVIGNTDDVSLVAPSVIASVANDPNFVVCGVSMGASPDNGFGWHQFQGIHPAAKHAATAMIRGDGLKAGTGVLEAFGTATAVVGGTAGTAVSAIVGYQVAIHEVDNVPTKSPVMMCLLPAYM